MAHRGDVRRRAFAAMLMMTALLPWRYSGADDGQPCEVIPMPCTFEAAPFRLRVIDAETLQPLVDVHALVEWQMEGAGGRANGPLMVKDALSGADGQLSFD